MTHRYYVTDGPMADTISECSVDYFEEALLSGMGAVDIHLADGSTDSIAGTRYLQSSHHNLLLRAEELDDHTLEIIYMGEVLAAYPAGQWMRWDQRHAIS